VVWERRELPSGVRGGALAENGFQCFPSVKQCLVEMFVVNWGHVRRRLLVEKSCICSSGGIAPPRPSPLPLDLPLEIFSENSYNTCFLSWAIVTQNHWTARTPTGSSWISFWVQYKQLGFCLSSQRSQASWLRWGRALLCYAGNGMEKLLWVCDGWEGA